MNAPMNTLAIWLVDFHVAATLLLLAGLLATLLLRQPARRLAVGWATMAGLALLLFLCALPQWPRVSWFTLPAATSPSATVTAGQGGPIEATALRQMDPNQPPGWPGHSEALARKRSAQPAPSAESTTGDVIADVIASEPPGVSIMTRLVPWLAAVFAAGTSLVAFWLILGAAQTLRLRRNATEAPAAFQAELERLVFPSRRVPRLLVSPRVAGPIATGVFRPAIIVPSQLAADATPAGLALVLAHEWAHVRNRDLWLLALGRALLLVLFAHPLYWWLQRRNRHDQEAVADAEVVDRASRTDYAKELVNWAQHLHGRPSIYAAALGIWERPSSLTRRIKMILDETRRIHARCSRRWHCVAFVIATVLTIGASLLTLQPAASGNVDAATPENVTQTPVRAEPNDLTYHGTVVDAATGKPISGATVVVARLVYPEQQPPQFKMIGQTEHRTDAAGKYQFVISPEHAAKKSLFVSVVVSHPDYISWGGGTEQTLAAIREKEARGQRPFFERLAMQPAESIWGTLVDPDGKPIEGVEVRVEPFGSPPPAPQPATATGDTSVPQHYHTVCAVVLVDGTGRTNRDGTFRAKLPKGDRVRLTFVSKQYAPRVIVVGTERGDLGRFALAKGVTLNGRALDAGGTPIEGAVVRLQWLPGASVSYVETTAPSSSPPTLTVNDSARWTTVSATLQIDATGPLSAPPLPTPRAVTDRRGQFTLSGLAPGQYQIDVQGNPPDSDRTDDRPMAAPAAFPFTTVTIDASPPVQTTEIRAVPHVAVDIRCVDSSGKPSDDLSLAASAVVAGSGNSFAASSDRDGKLPLKLPKGPGFAVLSLNARTIGGVWRWRTSESEPLQNGQTIVLDRLDRDISGLTVIRYREPMVLLRAVNETGNRVRGSQPSVTYPKGTYRHPPGWGAGTGESDVIFVPRPDGNWQSIRLVPEVEFTLTVEAPGYEPRSEKMTLAEGAVKNLTWRLKEKRAEPRKVIELPRLPKLKPLEDGAAIDRDDSVPKRNDSLFAIVRDKTQT